MSGTAVEMKDAGARTRAVVLTTQRTGSTFLVDCLASHPQIECAGEILIGLPDTPRPQYRGALRPVVKLARFAWSGAWLPGLRMERFYSRGTAEVRVFKAMYNHLANPFTLRYLRQHREIRILHLQRHNLLKVHVSKLLMPKRARVQADRPVEIVRIHVDPAEAVAALRRARSQHERFDRLFEDHARLPITYEELFDRQYLRADTAAKVCDFLGVERYPMQSHLVKLNPESLRDIVTNYEELAAAVSRSEFADMLDP